MASTRKYTDQRTGIEFLMTGDWPVFRKGNLEMTIVAPIVDAVSEIGKKDVFARGLAQKIDFVQVDIVAARECRLLDFGFGPCKVEFSNAGSSYELTVKAPSGKMDPLVFEAKRIKYLDIDIRIDVQRLLAQAVLNKAKATLPFDTVLGNGYFLRREVDFVKGHQPLIEEIIKRSVSESPVWQIVSSQGNIFRMVADMEERYSGLQRVSDIDYGSLIVLGPKEVYARTRITARPCITTYGEDNGMLISTDKAVDVIELSGGNRYAIFAVGAFKGGNTKHQIVAITDGETTKYHPSVESGDMKTENESCISIPFIVECEPNDVDAVSARIKEHLKTVGTVVFTPTYVEFYDLENKTYCGVVQMPVGNKFVTDYRGAVEKVKPITSFLKERVGAKSPAPEQLKQLPQ